MEDIAKTRGLQHIIKSTLTLLDKSDIASFRLVNQDCKNIVDDPIFSLKKLSHLKNVPKDLIQNWQKIIQNHQHEAFEIKQDIAMELFRMFGTNSPRYPLQLAYKLAETKCNPNLVMAILEKSDPKRYVKAPETLTGNLRPIHLAACFGYVQAARTMILNSTPVDLQDEYGTTPLNLAAQNGHLEMVQELLNFSANPNISFNDGRTPIHQAAKSGHVEIVKLLIPSIDNPNAANNDGNTPIIGAAQNGHVEIVKLLMSSTDNPNAPANTGVTPIHWAARNGHFEIVQLLMPSAENPNAPDNFGRTPLMYAQQNSHQKIVNLLNAHNTALPTHASQINQ